MIHQIGNTENIPSAFLDHHGVLGKISLPILTAEAIIPPNPQPPRVPMFQYPIPEHTLAEWKAKVAVDSYMPTMFARATALSLKESIDLPTDQISTAGKRET